MYVVSCKLPFKEFSEWEVAKQPNQIQSEWFLVGKKNTGKTCLVALVHGGQRDGETPANLWRHRVSDPLRDTNQCTPQNSTTQ